MGRLLGVGQIPSFVPPAGVQAFPAPPRPRQPAPAARSGAPSPLPSGAVTSAAGAGVRLQAAPHPSARAREPSLPSASSGPPGGGAAVGGPDGRRPPALGQPPPGPRCLPGDSRAETAAPRALARDWPGRGGRGEERQAGGAAVWSPSNRARPGTRLCAKTRDARGRGPRPLPTAQAPRPGGSPRGAAGRTGSAGGERRAAARR